MVKSEKNIIGLVNILSSIQTNCFSMFHVLSLYFITLFAKYSEDKYQYIFINIKFNFWIQNFIDVREGF